MRKVFAILVVVVLIVTLSSCGSTNYNADINVESSGVQENENSSELPREEESQAESNTSSNQEDSVIQNSQSSNISSENKNESNDEQLKDSVGKMDTNYAIQLDSSLPDDTYTLKYEDSDGIIADYAEICDLKAGESYDGFIKQNVAPQNATKIGVYNSLGERAGSVAFAANFKRSMGKKLYSFGAISDTHVGAKTAESDLKNALKYFEDNSEIQFIVNGGDLSLSGETKNLELYKSIVSTYTTKSVYAISGNHEAAIGYLAMDALKSYTGQNLYYSFTKGNDIFIMMGMYDVHAGCEFANGQLQWLYETLEENKDKRCFLFMHLNPRDGSGDAVDLDLAGDMLNNTQGKVFYSLLSHYSNIVYFHGHTHEEFAIQEVNDMNNYDCNFGCHSVHIPSLAYPKCISGNKLASDYDGSEGYVVEVYENSIVLRGRDFVTGKFLPIANYCLNTKSKKIESNTYYDSTQTILNVNSNILKSGGSWYSGSLNRSEITEVSFATSFNETEYDESWDASISGNNQITAYRIGSKVTVVGGENGIYANADSSSMFSGFNKLTVITGLNNIDTSNITSFASVFLNCAALKEVDISNFDLSKVCRYNALFKGCSSLVSFKLPSNMGAAYTNLNVYSQLFEDCTSLMEADLSALTNKNSYLSGIFNGCTSLKSAKFGKIKASTVVNLFYKCSNITEIDMSNVDFSLCDSMLNMFSGCKKLTNLTLPSDINTAKVKNMRSVFSGCSELKYDCSGWNTTSCTDVTNFNYNAPNVIAPTLS
ncbi:MAG: BspA family leucine-rich repeat surface protein [Clostridia bacterium]|nr:BspA family leucine-rich repeat surface protein [Clostridia bacterium]